MTTVSELIERLKEKAVPENLAGMAKYGMTPTNRLGVSVPDIRQIAKETRRSHELALALWETRIQEARMLAAMIDEPAKLTGDQMETWVMDFDSWDVCDQVCCNLFEKTPLAWEKIQEWSQRNEEFVKRAAFALLACLAWHDKAAADEQFIACLPVILGGSVDDRNYVKKAVNWALRNIGKRNSYLNQAAIATALDMQQLDSKAARWNAADALRELQSEAVQQRFIE